MPEEFLNELTTTGALHALTKGISKDEVRGTDLVELYVLLTRVGR